MPIIPNLNLIFIHIPKTGGSSINEYFNLQHLREKYSIVGNFLCENKLPGSIHGVNGKPFIHTTNDLRSHVSKGDFIRVGKFLYQIHSKRPLLPRKIHLAAIDNAKCIMQGDIACQTANYIGSSNNQIPIYKKLVSDNTGRKIIPSKFHWGWLTTNTRNGFPLVQVFSNGQTTNSGKPAIELDHVSIKYIKSRLPSKVFNSMYKFCIVRNPYSRLVSEYFWKIKDNDVRFGIDCKRLRFTGFIKLLEKKFPKLLFQPQAEVSHYLPQYMYVCDNDGSIMVDTVIKIEDGLESGLEKVLNHIGVDTKTPIKLNKSNKTVDKRRHYSTYYTEETKNIVYRLYQRDFEIFNYPKEILAAN